jgi:hypothetical protein
MGPLMFAFSFPYCPWGYAALRYGTRQSPRCNIHSLTPADVYAAGVSG